MRGGKAYEECNLISPSLEDYLEAVLEVADEAEQPAPPTWQAGLAYRRPALIRQWDLVERPDRTGVLWSGLSHRFRCCPGASRIETAPLHQSLLGVSARHRRKHSRRGCMSNRTRRKQGDNGRVDLVYGEERHGMSSTNERISLGEVYPGYRATITSIECQGPLRRRLMDMGLTPEQQFA